MGRKKKITVHTSRRRKAIKKRTFKEKEEEPADLLHAPKVLMVNFPIHAWIFIRNGFLFSLVTQITNHCFGRQIQQALSLTVYLNKPELTKGLFKQGQNGGQTLGRPAERS